MSSEINSRLIEAERALTEAMKNDVLPAEFGGLLKSSNHGLMSTLSDRFAEKVMLKIISVRLKQEKFYSLITNLMVTGFVVLAALLMAVFSSSLGSFEYQPLANVPSPSFVLPGLMALLALVIIDQALSSNAIVSKNSTEDSFGAFSG